MSEAPFDPRYITHGRIRHDLIDLRTEMLICVNGMDQWREARYETPLGRLQGEVLYLTPVLRPILREGEQLIETLDEGPVAIISIVL